jgi:Protein of unknown function (DUF3995)
MAIRRALMKEIVVALTGGILLLLSAWHFYWAAGGTWGKALAVPRQGDRPLLRPSSAVTLAVAILLAVAAALVLAKLKTWEEPGVNRLVGWGNLALAAVFGLRAVGDTRWVGFFKRVRGTPFAILDTWVYSPLCIFLCFGCVYTAQP